jgi:hypothetical protein
LPFIDRTFRLTSNAGSLGLECTSAGVSLAGVPLLRKTLTGLAPRPADEIASLMKAALGQDIDPAPLTPGLEVIAEALNRGDVGRAMIAALHLRLPRLNPEGATRIAKAHDVLTKYDPSEPRDDHGRWTADGESGPRNSALPQGHSPGVHPHTLKPIFVSNPPPPHAANDNDLPKEPPRLAAYALTMLCVRNARDPDYQTKVEACKAAFETCGWLLHSAMKNPLSEDTCTWPDGSSGRMKFGFFYPSMTGKPF